MKRIEFQNTGVPWQAYKNCIAVMRDYKTGRHICLEGYDESPTGYEWTTTTTLTAESFILLWQTSLDEADFVGRLRRLQEENPTFRMWNWKARANNYRKQGVNLQKFPTVREQKRAAQLRKLKKLAKTS